MSRKFIVAVAAVAALGTVIATDASARFAGGGGHFGGGHASFSRASFHPARISTGRTVSRTFHTSRVTTFSRVNHPNLHRPNFRHFHYAHYHHNHYRWWWCRHHHYRCGGWYGGWYGGVDGDYAPVEAAVATPQPVAATPVAAVCNNDCDYFLKDEPGCYMAKRAFSTPSGDELRCVKICEEPGNAEAPK